MSLKRHPVLLIHGLWLHRTSWKPWQDAFESFGYATHAPGWPGERDTVADARAHPEAVADVGIEDVVEHHRLIIEKFDEMPILLGHSFGGMIAEKLLGMNLGAAAVAIDAAQIKGVYVLPLSALWATFPVLKNPSNKHRSVMLTSAQFRFAFGNALPEAESQELFDAWAVPAPGRPLFEAATANFRLHSPAEVDTGNDNRGPLLLVMGGQDHTVPEAVSKSTARRYRRSAATTDVLEFKNRGHSLTIDGGWREVADASLAWLDKQGL